MAQDCLTENELQRIIDGKDGGREGDGQIARIERHLESCSTCRSALERLAGPVTTYLDEDPSESSALSGVIANLKNLPTIGNSNSGQPTGIELTSFPLLEPPNSPEDLGSLGKYNVIRLLGRGGMGMVFAAIDTALEREVAIKVPTPSLFGTVEAHERFLREARSIAGVKHDNIVTVYSVEELDHTPILVMELVEGQSLAERLTLSPRLTCQEIIRIGGDAASALGAAHAQGIVHRDIKPANVLLEQGTNRAKLTDFGLAKSAIDNSLTGSGVLAGTPQYMSPEQANEQCVGPQSDLFSLGAVLYHVCSGSPPFDGSTTLTILRHVVETEPQPLHEVNPEIPKWFSLIVQQLMAKNPSDRPRSAADVSAALRHEVPVTIDAEDEKPAIQPAAIRGWGGSWWWLAIAVTLLIALIPFFRSFFGEVNDRSSIKNQPAQWLTVKGIGEFATAVATAADGSTIEIHSDGPFRVAGFDLGDRSIVIKAAAGSKPVFTPEGKIAQQPFLKTKASLTLEGLEIHWPMIDTEAQSLESTFRQSVIIVNGASLTMNHCRIKAEQTHAACACTAGSVAISDSHIVVARGPGLSWHPFGEESLSVNNCVWEGDNCAILLFARSNDDDSRARFELQRNSFVTRIVLTMTVERPMQSFKGTANQNACDSEIMLQWSVGDSFERFPGLAFVRTTIGNSLKWQESSNGYRKEMRFLEPRRGWLKQKAPRFEHWMRLWGPAATGAFEASFVERSGDLEDQFQKVRAIESNVADVGADLRRVGPEGVR